MKLHQALNYSARHAPGRGCVGCASTVQLLRHCYWPGTRSPYARRYHGTEFVFFRALMHQRPHLGRRRAGKRSPTSSAAALETLDPPGGPLSRPLGIGDQGGMPVAPWHLARVSRPSEGALPATHYRLTAPAHLTLLTVTLLAAFVFLHTLLLLICHDALRTHRLKVPESCKAGRCDTRPSLSKRLTGTRP